MRITKTIPENFFGLANDIGFETRLKNVRVGGGIKCLNECLFMYVVTGITKMHYMSASTIVRYDRTEMKDEYDMNAMIKYEGTLSIPLPWRCYGVSVRCMSLTVMYTE